MKKLLETRVGKEIGINVDSTNHVEPVILDSVHESYFTVTREKNDNVYHIPYSAIVQMIENENGVIVGGFLEHKQSFSFVIHIGHMVEYMPT